MIKRILATSLLYILSAAVNAQTASSNFNNEDAGFAVDGDPGTRWTTEVVQANGMYFQLDFGAPASMSGVTLDSSGSRTAR